MCSTLPEPLPAAMKELCVEGASSTEDTVNWCLPSRMIMPGRDQTNEDEVSMWKSRCDVARSHSQH